MSNFILKQSAISKIQTVYCDAGNASDLADILLTAERIEPINVHSHGKVIDDLITWLESALHSAKALQLEVQGR